MPLEIELIGETQIPLEVEAIRPDLLRGKNLDGIKKLRVFHGKEEVECGEFFRFKGEADDLFQRWTGDFSGVHWIGAGMSGGLIEIEGNAGRHLGSEMQGGEIKVQGNASDWVGAEMKGGKIVIQGDGGHLVGAAYRGSARGMTGGTILVHGKTGNEVGHTLRRGLIAVGSVGDLAGFNMLAGSVLVFGSAGIRHGAGMRRGTLAFWGTEPPELLPTFRFACRQELNFVAITERFLKAEGLNNDFPEKVDVFHGDFLEGGRGEILIAA
ncbi:MAG: formylmethanofuran dehydrogenase subunit C [Planctomycetota bacterium]|nr:formylmethanofuran dehydrogenase subunit C [Planctomycetota bacterium]